MLNLLIRNGGGCSSSQGGIKCHGTHPLWEVQDPGLAGSYYTQQSWLLLWWTFRMKYIHLKFMFCWVLVYKCRCYGNSWSTCVSLGRHQISLLGLELKKFGNPCSKPWHNISCWGRGVYRHITLLHNIIWMHWCWVIGSYCKYCNDIAPGADFNPLKITMKTWIIYVLFFYVSEDEPWNDTHESSRRRCM